MAGFPTLAHRSPAALGFWVGCWRRVYTPRAGVCIRSSWVFLHFASGRIASARREIARSKYWGTVLATLRTKWGHHGRRGDRLGGRQELWLFFIISVPLSAALCLKAFCPLMCSWSGNFFGLRRKMFQNIFKAFSLPVPQRQSTSEWTSRYELTSDICCLSSVISVIKVPILVWSSTCSFSNFLICNKTYAFYL